MDKDMNPPTGYYRKIIGNKYPDVRIVITNTPTIGFREYNSEPILKVLEECNDRFAKFYSTGIKNGTLVTIEEIRYDRITRKSTLVLTPSY